MTDFLNHPQITVTRYIGINDNRRIVCIYTARRIAFPHNLTDASLRRVERIAKSKRTVIRHMNVIMHEYTL